MTTGVRANTHHVAVGLCILLLGVLLILDRLGIVGAEFTLRYWPVGLIIIGASVMLQAFSGEPTTRTTVPWGAIFWLFVVGLVLSHVFERRAVASHAGSRPDTSIFAVLGGSTRSPQGTFTHGDITTMMGGARLDLRNVDAKPGERIVVDVFTLMGGAVIYIPDDWRVDVEAISLMGGIDDRRRGTTFGGIGPLGPRSDDDASVDSDIKPPADGSSAPDVPPVLPDGAPTAPAVTPLPDRIEADTPPASAPPTLVIRGYVTMGGLQIKSR